MLAQQRKLRAACGRIMVFFIAHEDRFGTVIAGALRLMTDVIQSIDDLSDEQDPTRFQRAKELQAERGARYTLRERHLRRIAAVAALVLDDAPELDRLRLPEKKCESQVLLMFAREMAKAAEPHTATFVANGLAPDFLTGLLAAMEELQQAINSRGKAHSSRVGATAGLRAVSTRAMRVIAFLDSLIAPEIAGDDQLSKDWVLTRTVARRKVKSAVAEESVPAAASPAATMSHLTLVASSEEIAA
jgi:hypothetical protein